MSYTWANPEQTYIKYETEDFSMLISTDPTNPRYAEFLASGETAAAYVAPPPPEEPTPEEKLAASGLTVDELKDLLGI